MSRNTHVTFADNIRLLPGCSNHSRNFASAPKLGRHPFLTLICTFSLSLIYCSSLTLPTCASHSCTHCLAVFPLALLISPFSLLPHFRYPHSHFFRTSDIPILASSALPTF